jgi:type I restriction enzyme S subunit
LTEDWREGNNIPAPIEVTLGKIMKVSSGNFLTSKQMAKDGSIPVYGGNGVTGYHNKGNVSEPTLVIGRVGYYCGSVHLTPKIAWITDNALIVEHDLKQTSKQFLYYALQSLNLRVNDSATAQPVISGQKIYPISICIPDLREQHEIVRRVEKLFKLADLLEVKYAKAMEQVQKIEQSVLAKAFRGELAPQDPNDEPAEELLKRILAEKAKLEGVKKKSKRFSPRQNRYR